MRKSIYIILVIIMVLSLSACGKKEKSKPDAVAQKMIDDINSIGDVTVDDEDLINRLLSTYSTLTEKQKESVNNYAILLEAQDKLVEIKKKKAEDESKKEEEEQANKDKQFENQRKYYKLAQEGIDAIKSNTKHPGTFHVTGVFVTITADGKYNMVDVEFEAENDFGNSVSTYARYTADLLTIQADDKAKNFYLSDESRLSGSAGSDFVKVEDNSYTYDLGAGRYYAFKLDLIDYTNQGYSGVN